MYEATELAGMGRQGLQHGSAQRSRIKMAMGPISDSPWGILLSEDRDGAEFIPTGIKMVGV
jgi:hypothetical protein